MEGTITCESNGNFRITIPKHMLIGMGWLKDIYDKRDIKVMIEEMPPLGKITIKSFDAEILDYLKYIERIANQKNIKNRTQKINEARNLKKQFETYSKRDINFLFKIPESWETTRNRLKQLKEKERRKKPITAIEEKKDYINMLKSRLKSEENDLRLLEKSQKTT